MARLALDLPHRVGAVRALRGQLALDHLERLGARQVCADTHERRPLLGPEIGLLCFQVRADQIQRLRLLLNVTDHISIGAPPWTAIGPYLAFLRLPSTMIGEVERVATIVNGDRHRQNIILGQPVITGDSPRSRAFAQGDPHSREARSRTDYQQFTF